MADNHAVKIMVDGKIVGLCKNWTVPPGAIPSLHEMEAHTSRTYDCKAYAVKGEMVELKGKVGVKFESLEDSMAKKVLDFLNRPFHTSLTSDDCPFYHENIDRLYNVTPVPVDQLPKTCWCGKPLTYAEEVMFINMELPKYEKTDGVEVIPVKCEPVSL